MGKKAAASATQLPEPASYQDVLDAPPHKVAEIIDGTLHMNPRPAPRHAWASSGLGARIGTPYNYGDGGPGGWWIIFEPELHLGEDILVPDRRAGVKNGCRTILMRRISPCHRTGCAKSSRPRRGRLDQGRKRDIYAREGVAYLWFVDPMCARWRPLS